MTKKRQIIIIIGIFLISIMIFLLLIHHKAKPKKTIVKNVIPVVKVIKARPVHYQMIIHANGEARPESIGSIVPEIRGKIVYVSRNLKKGGMLKKGELVVKIFDEDYKIALSQAIAKLKQANATLENTIQESNQAIEEWKLVHPNKDVPYLVAKVPQLEAARANFLAAKAGVTQAKLNLRRTNLYSPYNGVVLQKNIDIGQYVNPGQTLATIYPTSEIEVYIPLTLSDVQWIDIPKYTTNKKGSLVKLRFSLGQKRVSLIGEITRFLGEIDPKTRMLYVVAVVKNPFKHIPPLLPYTYLDANIQGRVLKNVYVIPMRAVFEDEYVLKVIKNHIKKTKIKIVRMLKDSVIVTKGIDPGDLLVCTPMSGNVDGMEVNIVGTK